MESSIDSQLKELQKGLHKKAFKWMYESRKRVIAVVVIGIIIGVVSNLHGMSETWAWEVAKALITINSFVLGFGILGITILARRGFTRAMYRTSVEESVNEFFEHLRKIGKGTKETAEAYITKEFISAFINPIIEIVMIRTVVLLSMLYVLASIGFAFCLFGVSNTTVNNPLLSGLFSWIYCGAITTFLWGAYFVLRGIFSLLNKTTEIETGVASKIFMNALKKKLEDLKKKKAQK